jgi:hypothetical protein
MSWNSISRTQLRRGSIRCVRAAHLRRHTPGCHHRRDGHASYRDRADGHETRWRVHRTLLTHLACLTYLARLTRDRMRMWARLRLCGLSVHVLLVRLRVHHGCGCI